MINLDVNLVVWAEHKEKAKYLASMISRGKIVRIPEVYQLEVQIPPSGDQSEYLLSIKCFYCWAGSYLLNTPENLTDILILNIEGTDTKYLEEAINFADFRRSVPIKYMVSNEDISDIAIKLDCEFAYEDHVKEASFIQKIIDETKDIDFTLRKVFNRIDTDGNGFINYKELKNKSKELAYKMTEEESKEIVYTLSKDGNIRYEDFKKWWIMGKQDFIYFRRLVDYELNFNNLLQVTSPFLKKLKIEMERVSSKYLEHESKITIVSREENQYSEFYQDFIFYPATILSAKLVTGMEVESLLESLPRYIKSDPLTFGIELCLISSEFGAHVIALLKEIKDNLKESEFYKEILKLGFTVNFRHVYKTIYIECSMNILLYENLFGKFSGLNVSFKDNVGSANLHFLTELTIQQFLDMKLDEFIQKLSHFKLQYHGEYSNLRTVLLVISEFVTTYYGLNIHPNIEKILDTIKLLSNITQFHVNIKYKAEETARDLKEIISCTTAKNSSIGNDGKKAMMKEGFKRAEEKFLKFKKKILLYEKKNKQNFYKFLKPYLSSLKLFNLDKIQIFAISPIIKIYLKIGIDMEGITQFISNKIYSYSSNN